MSHPKLFEAMLQQSPLRRIWIFPLSVLIHAGLIMALVVFPILQASSLPGLRIVDLNLKAFKSPPPPQIQVGETKTRKIDGKSQGKPIVKRIKNIEFKVPPVISDIIAEEDLFPDDDGSGTGVKGAIPGDTPGIDIPEDQIFKGPVGNAPPVWIVKSPTKITDAKPIYPVLAQRAHIQATVKLEAVTDVYGKVKTIRVIEGHPLLNQAAIDAVKKWVYEPYVVCGFPKPVQFSVEVRFILQ